jgi:hypothetical protein
MMESSVPWVYLLLVAATELRLRNFRFQHASDIFLSFFLFFFLLNQIVGKKKRERLKANHATVEWFTTV